MRTASSTASCAAGVWANAAVVTSKRVNRVRIAVLDARGTDLVAGPRGSAPLNLSCKHPIRSSEVAGTLRAYRRQPLPNLVKSELPVIRPRSMPSAESGIRIAVTRVFDKALRTKPPGIGEGHKKALPSGKLRPPRRTGAKTPTKRPHLHCQPTVPFRGLAGYADCVITRSKEEVSSIALCSVRYRGQCIA